MLLYILTRVVMLVMLVMLVPRPLAREMIEKRGGALNGLNLIVLGRQSKLLLWLGIGTGGSLPFGFGQGYLSGDTAAGHRVASIRQKSRKLSALLLDSGRYDPGGAGQIPEYPGWL